MFAIEHWSSLLIIFILLAEGNRAIPLGDSNSEESGLKEHESIFQLILSNDVYTTSRSLGSESDDYEQKETSTIASKAVSREKRSLESQDDIYDNEQKEQTTVALKAANVNRSLDMESDENYYEQENSTVVPIPTAVSTGYKSLESQDDIYDNEQKEQTTVALKAANVNRSIETESDENYNKQENSTVVPIPTAVSTGYKSLESQDDIYDNEQKEQTTVALKAANVNRSLETESDENYYEQENSTLAPISTAVSTGYKSLEKESDEYSHEHSTILPTAISTGDGYLRVKSESQEKKGQKKDSVEEEKDNAELVQGRRDDYNDHSVYVSTYGWTHQTFPATRKREPTKAWSALMVDDYFLPYMGASLSSLSGDWVYYQKTVVKGWDWPVVGSTLFYFPEKRTDGPPDTFQRYCTKLYQRMGPVCGYRMNQGSWQYNYRNFKDWCELEYMNSLNYFDRFAWSILNRGECPYNSPFFPDMWSSQDGLWNLQSMDVLLDKAKEADDDVEYVMHHQG